MIECIIRDGHTRAVIATYNYIPTLDQLPLDTPIVVEIRGDIGDEEQKHLRIAMQELKGMVL